jgi:hypothetical protein
MADKFRAQNSDAENARGLPSVRNRTQSLRSRKLGNIESIANADYREQQADTGKGAEVVTANTKKG